MVKVIDGSQKQELEVLGTGKKSVGGRERKWAET